VKLISLSELRAAEGFGRSRILDAYKADCRDFLREVTWLLNERYYS